MADQLVFKVLECQIFWPALRAGQIDSVGAGWMSLQETRQELQQNSGSPAGIELKVKCPLCGEVFVQPRAWDQAYRCEQHLIDNHGIGGYDQSRFVGIMPHHPWTGPEVVLDNMF
jgi:hypothetical protein